MGYVIKRIGSTSSREESEEFINAYLYMFNNEENIKYLSFTGIRFARETIEKWFSCADEANVEYYTAVEDGEICAILIMTYSFTDGYEIMAMVVDEKYRRSGIGKSLLKIAESRAAELGFRSVSVKVFVDNKRMLSLLIKSAYKPYKIEPRMRWDGEDLVYLKINL